MQTPKFGRELLADQDVAGADVSMEKVFAVKELLIKQQDKTISGLKQTRSVQVI